MKHIKLILLSVLVLPLLSSCSDDDYNAPTPAGNPIATAISPTSAVQMGSSVVLKVNCKDDSGEKLSTLKAFLSFSGETVYETTLRTVKDGDYDVTIDIPFLQNVPDGKADIVLVLQNVTTKTYTTTVSVDVVRPHFTNLQYVSSDGTKYNMTETSNHTYSAAINVPDNGFKGHFETSDGKYVFGSDGSKVALGQSANLAFQTKIVGNINVTFNTCDWTYAPQEELEIIPIELTNSDDGKTFVGTLTQGVMYKFTGDGATSASDWYYDADYFTKNDNGSYTFNGITGTYTIYSDFTNKYFRIWMMDGENPASLSADGSGAVWIIGNEGINKPTWSTINHGWWTGTDSDVCLTQIRDKVYQITLTIGKELRATDVNFKFFGQANWGNEFKGSAATYHVSSTSDVFLIGDGNGHDDGNIYIADGVTLVDGDTYVMTLDLSAGSNNGVLSVEKK